MVDFGGSQTIHFYSVMKHLFTLALLLGLSLSSFASSRVINWAEALGDQPEISTLSSTLTDLSAEDFIALTPKQVREITGEKLSVREALQLRAAQRLVKKQMNPNAEDIDKTVYIILAIVGLGWLAMGLLTDFDGKDWIVNIVLTLLCWLPGVIHAFIKMKDYY